MLGGPRRGRHGAGRSGKGPGRAASRRHQSASAPTTSSRSSRNAAGSNATHATRLAGCSTLGAARPTSQLRLCCKGGCRSCKERTASPDSQCDLRSYCRLRAPNAVQILRPAGRAAHDLYRACRVRRIRPNITIGHATRRADGTWFNTCIASAAREWISSDEEVNYRLPSANSATVYVKNPAGELRKPRRGGAFFCPEGLARPTIASSRPGSAPVSAALAVGGGVRLRERYGATFYPESPR